jgi:quinolinate synthase
MENSIELLKEKIRKLAKEKNAIILVHNYQSPEIQEIADLLGDSLILSKKAAETEADIIVFCGVKFMAETAKILSPEKKVLLPRFDAGCQMADMITSDELLKLKNQYPDAEVVSYVNTTAEIKSHSDVCCTSSNAVKIVQNVNSKKIIFVPDKNLGSYCKSFLGNDKEMIVYNGFCYVHNQITPEKIQKTKIKYPNAQVISHPECPFETLKISDEVVSTEGMMKIAENSTNKEFIIATESGIIDRLKREFPENKYYEVEDISICKNMKLTKLEDVYNSLKYEKYEIKLDKEIIEKSKSSLEKMLQYI